ncbi:GNAT family N-acetyltransferase [Streptomyces sp. enrichment culture]|uniref:GNAT family N-acetyltransferase n=1 Tax=Streptomyces sp. enrichment culture TaxID=1795815 RepID=UPI003F56FB27
MSDVTDGVTRLLAHGPAVLAVLLASLAALIAAAGFRSRWSRRHGQAPPPDDTGARPPGTLRRVRPRGRGGAGDGAGDARTTGAGVAAAAAGGTGLVDAGPDATPDAGASALWRMRTTVRDAPGSLAVLCAALADRRIDILSLQTHPLAEGTVDEFLLRAPAELTGSELADLVTSAGGTHTWTERADAHDLVDAPTRLLGLAARTALDAAELPLALRQLLGRCTIRSLPAATAGPAVDDVPPQGTLEDTVLRLRAPEGGVISVERPYLPFTPAEFARARALVELDARLGPRLPRGRDVLTLSEGRDITVRRADTRDVEAAKAMHERCSARTLGMRYHGPVGDADRYLNHLLSPRFGRTLAVQTASGRIVGLGHLLWDGDETEVALLVEDAWQRRGVGAELLGRLVAMAAETGCEQVYAVTRASNTGMVAAMRGLGLPLDYQIEEGTLVVTARLEPASPAAVPLPHAERVGTD